jgi:hypothetical protein
VLEPGTWALWEEVRGASGKKEWVQVGAGVTSLDHVPLAVFYAGERRGPQMVTPPLINLAREQLALFRLEAAEQNVETRGAFMMLAANGMMPPAEGSEIVVGPMAVLFGGENGSWAMLEPSGSTFEHFRLKVDAKKQEMRRLGMQPLLPGTGSVTATATGVEAAKAHSLVQTWALRFADTMEAALSMLGEWIGDSSEPEVAIHTDFGLDVTGQDDATLLALRENRTISRIALVDEMKRRGRLMADYDPEEDQEQIDAETEAAMALLPDIVPGQPGAAGGENEDQGGEDTPPGNRPPVGNGAAGIA